MPMANPTVGRRVTAEQGTGTAGAVSAPGMPAVVSTFSRAAYAIPLATLIALALTILILFKLADFRFAVSGAVAAGR